MNDDSMNASSLNILDRIVASTRERVEREKLAGLTVPIADPRSREPFCFEESLRQSSDIAFICEVKKASPSRGVISEDFPYLDIARAYEAGGAAAMSILTEPEFFQGSDRYLAEIRKEVRLPILRKDFIIDADQIERSALMGADAILLICSILTFDELTSFLELAHSLGLSCLVETHDAEELKMAVAAGARVVGVNNRDLKTFKVDLGNSLRMRQLAPPEVTFVSESGIRNAEDVERLRQYGIDAVLIGEALMIAPDPRAALAELRGDR
jgi:indole-3-glycerol phosphate synthase